MSRIICVAALLAAIPFGSANTQDRVFATQPGFGLGFSAGIDGSSDAVIESSMGYEGFFRYGWSFGLFLQGGVHVNTNNLTDASQQYRATSFFLEPRYVALSVSPKLAPFVSGRLGYTKENMSTPGAELASSGLTLGGGGGMVFRLTNQVALEGSFSILTTSFGDFTFRGERGWYQCLESLDSGTTMPEAIVQCTSASGSPQYNCYPPFFDELAGSCTSPTIPYEGSKRSSTWFQFKLGVHLSVATP